MPLLLCRQTAELPFCHDKLNINIKSEQELCFVIYNYPILCLGDFLSERLYSWIESQLLRADLAQHLRQSERQKERAENRLVIVLRECNYYDVNEIMEFTSYMTELAGLSHAELVRKEGAALFKAGSFKSALDRLELSVKELEAEFRRTGSHDDRGLRELNEKKADLYCDMAAVKLQMFDERSAIELLETSQLTLKNERAERMRYLIDGSGELSEEVCAELDSMKDEVRQKVRAGKAYCSVLDIFEGRDTEEIFREAKKLAAGWKKDCRRM